MQAGRERLLKAHEQIPRPELAAVRVTGELQIEAGRGCRRRRARLMREQDARTGIVGASCIAAAGSLRCPGSK